MRSRLSKYNQVGKNNNSKESFIKNAGRSEMQGVKSGASLHHFNSISVLPTPAQLIQPKLQVNPPGDKYEQEADQVADRVVNGHSLSAGSISPVNSLGHMVQRKPIFAKDSGCDDFSKCELVAAWDLAKLMMNETISNVNDVVSKGAKSSHHSKVNALFSGLSQAQLVSLQTSLVAINAELNGAILSNCKDTKICSGNTLAATSCTAQAEVQFCKTFFTAQGCLNKARAIIHELAHHVVCGIAPPIVVPIPKGGTKQIDDVYIHMPQFKSLTAAQAIQNPDSIAQLCLNLSTKRDCFDCSRNMQIGEKEYQKYLDKIKKDNTAPEKKKPAPNAPVQKVQRKCAKCSEEEEHFVQPKLSTTESGSTSTAISPSLQQSKGSGQPMNAATSAYMESRFGADFSKVRIHSDHRAAEMSRNINALAFTAGNDIYFNQGAFNPSSSAGKRLLAHELTHTIQQKNHQN